MTTFRWIATTVIARCCGCHFQHRILVAVPCEAGKQNYGKREPTKHEETTIAPMRSMTQNIAGAPMA
jgi:hypothetical protein